MKKLLSDFFSINENDIISYRFNGNNDLSIGVEHDYGSSYSIINGEISEPQYEVVTNEKKYWVNLNELLVYIYIYNK